MKSSSIILEIESRRAAGQLNFDMRNHGCRNMSPDRALESTTFIMDAGISRRIKRSKVPTLHEFIIA